MSDAVIDEAIEAARAFLEAEREGRGAVMLKGKMSDRATDRIYRVALKTAYALGRLDEKTAKELRLV
jgi:citrate lyase beta subunit